MSSDRIKPPAIWKQATTNTNRNEETASSAGGTDTNRNSATTTAIIRTRSPRKMKTQIAKVVYDRPTTKPNRDIVVNETETTPLVGEDEFQKKREDRDREVKEIQEMLNEITNIPTKEKNDEEVEQQERVITKNSPTKTAQPPIQRSKTETNLHIPTARRSQLRLRSQTARSKSAHTGEKENASPKDRQKKYSSEEARRYMQEQKKKRKSLQTAPLNSDRTPAIDKNEIKKRLENLRKNTRMILDKNVKMAKKKSMNSPISVEGVEEDKGIAHQAMSKEMAKELEIRINTARVGIYSERPPMKRTPVEKPQDPSPLSENYKKVGLLRKPEYKDHSFSAIKDFNMDKENLIVDFLTPQLVDVPTSRLNEVVTVERKKPEVVLIAKNIDLEQNHPLEQSKRCEVTVAITKRNEFQDIELKIPEVKLKSRTSLREKSVQVDRSASGSKLPQTEKNTELPFWLKPTAVQAYPYNFIVAVRKKLEAIANPPAIASLSSSLEHQSKRRATETPLSYPKNNRTNNVKRRLIDNEDKSLTRSLEKSLEHQLSKSLSEFTSNFSSISIQLPESNTDSSVNSKNKKRIADEIKPIHFDEDDTTVSSSVFSSPEKRKHLHEQSKNLPPANADGKALSPLSVENVSNLHIQSKSMLKNVTLDRGDKFSSQPKLNAGAISSRSEGSVDFSQLLDDFNRSLSQVIEVNHQLKTTLVKSHQIFSPEKTKRPSAVELKSTVFSTKSMELAEYISDFEESSNAEEKQTKDSNGTRTSSSIPEIQTASSSETNNEKPSSSASSTEEAIEEEKSLVSLETQTFIVSSEEAAHDSPNIRTIHEEAIGESPNKDNMSANQYSRDSLDISPREEYVKSHINTSRGDYHNEASERSVGPPPSYKATSKSQDTADRSQSNFMNSSLDSEFVRVFNKSDMEISVLSLNRSLSESTINYSSIGLYEKLIQNETNKSDHLAALLKMREKALIDRTKGQIAWLEVQKERYKTKGLTLQISAVKKKQRGILLKMEKEREEIKKLLQQAKVQRDHKLRIPEIRPSSDVTLLQQRRTGIHQTSAASQTAAIYQQQHQQQKQQHSNQQQSARSKSSAIVRGYELETSRSLEQLLQKREEDLRRRREHVERLMEWHRRLDQEEAEVLQLERMLFDYNNVQVPQENTTAQEESNPSQRKIEKKLKEIDRSLRELSSISGGEGSADASADFVRTTGSKLNKLWRRLTSQRTEKFEPNKRYKLCKSDLEQLYEEAKLAVLNEFGENAGQMEVFLGQTSISTTQQSTLGVEVPQLNLNFSSGQSDVDMVRGNYSPCAAEEQFLGFAVASTSSREGYSEESGKESGWVSKRKVESVNSSSSAILSMPESDNSSRSGAKVAGKSTNVPENIKGDGPRTDFETASCSGSSTKTESKRASVPESVLSTKTGSIPKSVGGRTKAEASVIESVSIIGEITGNSLPDTVATASLSSKTETLRTSLTENVLHSDPSAKTESHPTSLVKSASNADESDKTPSIRTSVPENVSNSPTSAKSESLRTNLIESRSNTVDSRTSLPESLLQSASYSAKTENDQESAANADSNTQTESVRTNSSASQSMNSGSTTKVESHPTSVLVSDSRTKIESAPSTSQNTVSKSNGSRTLSSDSNAKTESNRISLPESKLSETISNAEGSTKTSLPKSGPNTYNSTQSSASARRSSEESTTASIVKSLLECAQTRSGILDNVSIAELSQSYLGVVPSNTNGNQQFDDWQSAPLQSNPSRELTRDSKPESLTNQSELIEETCATLRSIKSIDNSTNSKHSTDQTIKLTATSNSSKLESSSIESDVILSYKDTANSDQIQQETQNSRDVESEVVPHTYSSGFSCLTSEAAATSSGSNQGRSSVIISTRESLPQVEDPDTLTNAFYESDFTEGEETNIDDLSLPKFETTGDEEDQLNESQLNTSQSSSPLNRTDLEKRLIDLDVSLKDLNATFEKALSPEKTPSPPRDEGSNRSQQQHSKEQNDSALMPDIISEVELRRRQQVMLENEMKQFEHAVPYMYVREIPNKPPPPYVPPAHGSPMTTIFPSEERIKDITYRRTKELYHEILNIDTTDENGKKPPSVLDENITNIYERIILDICKEYLTEYEKVLTAADPNNFHSPLAFFNPPDRLKCMQDFIYKEVRKSLAMDKNSPKRNQVYSVYGHRGKRDHIGEIIIQEMYDEDDMWSNFYVEEAEVLELIIDEMIGGVIGDIAAEVLEEEVPRDPLAPAAAAGSAL